MQSSNGTERAGRTHAVLVAVSVVSAAVFVALAGVRGGLTLFAAILLHELGHAAAARFFTGRRPFVAVLPAFFGLTIATGLGSRPLGDRVAYQLAGSWLSSAVAVALLPLAAWSDWVYCICWAILLINFVNLLPIPGLDGGRIAWQLTEGLRRGWRALIAALLVVVGVVLAAWIDVVLVWLAWAVNSVLLLVLVWVGRRAAPEQAARPRESVAWAAAHVVTATALLHALWVLASMGDLVVRLERGMGRA